MKSFEKHRSIVGGVRQLTAAQIDRRKFMLGLLATGAYATLAGMPTGSVKAQTTNGGGSSAALDGPLAAEQVMTLSTEEPTTMDPNVSYGDEELAIFPNIFEGLVRIDQQTGEVAPGVAESYDFNDDGSEYTFTMRQGVTWSDGTPLNANDFYYSWTRVLDPNTLSQYIPALFPIKNAEKIANGELGIEEFGVEVVDDNTLKVTLEGPTPFFPLLATTWTFYPVPQHVIEEHGDQWVEAENIVTNGPYIMTDWTHDQQIVLEPNPNYFGEAPTLTKATYRIFADQAAQSYIAFENDELDYAQPEGPDLDRVLADPEASKNLISFPQSNCYFVVCDTTNPPTDAVEFRQALYKALSRETLASNVLNNQYIAAANVLPPNIPGNNPDATMTESPDEAKALLETAGIDPSSVEIELVHINSAFYKTVAEYLQAALQDNLGIKIKLSPIEDSAYTDWRASRETQPFNIYTGSWGSDFADASNWFNQNFTHAADHYRNHWNYPDFDELVDKAVINTDVEERNQQYSDAEVMLVEQAPIIPLLRGEVVRAIKPWVRDLYLQPLLSYVHLRTVKIQEQQ